MWEFEVEFITTGKRSFFFGYNLEDACHRAKTNPAEVEVLFQEYID